jgi:hypothetical protein
MVTLTLLSKIQPRRVLGSEQLVLYIAHTLATVTLPSLPPRTLFSHFLCPGGVTHTQIDMSQLTDIQYFKKLFLLVLPHTINTSGVPYFEKQELYFNNTFNTFRPTANMQMFIATLRTCMRLHSLTAHHNFRVWSQYNMSVSRTMAITIKSSQA